MKGKTQLGLAAALVAGILMIPSITLPDGDSAVEQTSSDSARAAGESAEDSAWQAGLPEKHLLIEGTLIVEATGASSGGGALRFSLEDVVRHGDDARGAYFVGRVDDERVGVLARWQGVWLEEPPAAVVTVDGETTSLDATFPGVIPVESPTTSFGTDVGMPVTAGTNVYVVALDGLAGLVSIEPDQLRDGTTLRWRLDPNSYVTHHSTANEGDWEVLAGAAVRTDGVALARLAFDLPHASTYVSVRSTGNAGELHVTGPSGDECTSVDAIAMLHDLFPFGTSVTAHEHGAGIHTLEARTTGTSHAQDHYVDAIALSVPFGPTTQTPYCE